MQTGLKIILIGLISIVGLEGFAQVRFKLELLPDETTYQVSLVSDVSWTTPPFNFTASAQVTIRAPHGKPPNNFQIENITPLQPNTDWTDNVYCPAPPEAPSWDYISLALISPGNGIPYIAGQETPLFTFTNGAVACVDSIELIDNETDPFLAPNSKGANIAHSIVTVGGGLGGSYSGNVGTGRAPCVPVLNCTEIITEFEEELCFGNSFRGISFANDTTIIDHYISCFGCDSIVQTHLKILPDYNLQKSETICSGESFNGETYYADATIFESLISMGGCDSFQTTFLKVLPHSFSNVDINLCSGDFYDGLVYFENATVTKTLVAENGCDSVVTSFIEVTPIEFDTAEISVCEGTEIGGQVFDVSGTFTEFFTNQNGCDTLSVLTNVEVRLNSQNSVEALMVAGELWNGTPYFNDTTVVQVLENEVGCDSILTGNLRVFPSNSIIKDTTLCEGEILLGQVLKTDTLLTHPMDDSTLLVLNTRVLPAAVIYHDLSICKGATVAGIAHFQDTILTEVFNGTNTCDSVIVTKVYVTQPVHGTDDFSICLGEFYEGIAYQTDTILIDTLTSFLTGCDSILRTNLNVIQPKETVMDASICAGETFEGNVYQNDEIILKNLTSLVDGCDSLVQINLEVFPNPTPTIEGENTFCEGEIIQLTTQDYKTYQWNNGSNESFLSISESGIYELTVTNSNDCLGSTTFEANALKVNAFPQAFSPNCKEPEGKIIFSQINGGHSPYTFSIDGGLFFEVDSIFENLAPNQYSLVVEDINGCQWTASVEVPEEQNIEWILPEKLRLDLGDSIRLPLEIVTPTYEEILWSPPLGLSCTNCPQPHAKPTESIHYQATIIDTFGCAVKAGVTVYVTQKSKIYIPNAFSPNGDGRNEKFYPFAGADVQEVKLFQVFDRNGALIFERENFQPNDANFGWDGGKYSNGVYVYLIEIEFINNRREYLKGEVNLVR
jgi:hypothetical protein